MDFLAVLLMLPFMGIDNPGGNKDGPGCVIVTLAIFGLLSILAVLVCGIVWLCYHVHFS